MTTKPAFAIATIEVQSKDGRAVQHPAIAIDNVYYPLPDDSSEYKSVLALLKDWSNALPYLETFAERVMEKNCTVKGISRPTLKAPILYPSKLLAVGANYTSHLEEMNLPAEKWEPMPFFLRPPTTTMVGAGRTVIIPASSKQFDWECELTVIIGKRLRNATREEAQQAIAGYTIGLDMSCRDLIPAGRGLGTDLVRGKAQDTMAPCGPHIVPAKFVQGEIEDSRIMLDVNGERMMDASTSEMIYKCDEILSIVSEFITLEPGDMVMTGSPAGSAGVHGNRWLRPGDVIRAEIQGIGILEVQMQSCEN